MNNYLMHSFLTSFFMLASVCGRFMNDVANQKMFIALAELYCLTDKKSLKKLYALSQEPDIAAIRTAADYERFCRVMSFACSIGQDPHLTETDLLILSQKGAAMAAVKTFASGRELLNQPGMLQEIKSKAAGGNIPAAEVYSFMVCNGICTEKNPENVLCFIRKSARWNSLLCNLLGLVYDAENKKTYLDNLYTYLHHINRDDAFAHIAQTYGFTDSTCTDPRVLLTEKGFEREIIDRSRYDYHFADVAYSGLLGLQEKEKLLLQSPNFVTTLPKLPYNATGEGRLTVCENVREHLPASREAEQEIILRNLRVTQMCPPSARKPLLLVSSDPFISECYADWLKESIGGVPVVELDAAKLETYDFAGTENNIFLRHLSATGTTRTVFIIHNCENLSAQCADELLKMIAFEYRKQCTFAQMQVTLDLSEMMFVLISHPEQVGLHLFSRECETIRLHSLSQDEKQWMVKTVFNTCKTEFDVPDFTLDEEAAAFLCAYSAGEAKQMLYAAMKNTVVDGGQCVTAENLKNVASAYGMGRNTRGFGFTGGNENA